MKNNAILGAVIGFAAGTAAAIAGKMAVDKVVEEIKGELGDQTFTSPEGNNRVTISSGSSTTAKGLAFLRVKATSDACEDECKLSLLTRKMPETLDAQWTDNDNFTLTLGKGKIKQYCDITFDGDEINALYYLDKAEKTELD